jgi:hypothetical protein
MQNRPNRCTFAMTDFGATTSLTHSASCKTSYGRFGSHLSTEMFHVEHPPKSKIGLNVPRGTLLEFLEEGRQNPAQCSTWNITRGGSVEARGI